MLQFGSTIAERISTAVSAISPGPLIGTAINSRSEHLLYLGVVEWVRELDGVWYRAVLR